jgi:hypothetical protein
MGSDNPSGADNQQERPSSSDWMNRIPLDLGNWVAGFVDGEGSFNVPIRREQVSFNQAVTCHQHHQDLEYRPDGGELAGGGTKRVTYSPYLRDGNPQRPYAELHP